MSEHSDGTDEARVRVLLELLEKEKRQAASGRVDHILEGDVGLPEVDLRTILAELTALKAAVRADASATRDVRDRMATAVDVLESELSSAREREVGLIADWSDRVETVGRRAMLDLIEIADRLEPAIEHARHIPRRGWAWLPWSRRDRAVDALTEGLELTLRRLIRRLEERGVRRLVVVDEIFDPTTMEAVDKVAREDLEDGVVVEEVTAGYVHDVSGEGQENDITVVRVAQVIVNRNPERVAGT